MAIEYLTAQLGDLHLVPVVIGYLYESHMEHLQQIVLPVVGGQVLADTECLQLVIAFSDHC